MAESNCHHHHANSTLASHPIEWTWTESCALKRVIGQIPKLGHVSSYTLETSRWLPTRQRIEYRIAALVRRCQLGLASDYLRELCCPSGIQGRRPSALQRSGCS